MQRRIRKNPTMMNARIKVLKDTVKKTGMISIYEIIIIERFFFHFALMENEKENVESLYGLYTYSAIVP